MMYQPTGIQTVELWSLFKGFKFPGPVFKAAYKYLNKASDTLQTDSTVANFSNRSQNTNNAVLLCSKYLSQQKSAILLPISRYKRL